jgi:hypothetical protein
MSERAPLSQSRLAKLARALGVTPTPVVIANYWDTALRVERREGCWVLSGCVEGDVWLPQSRGFETAAEAVNAAEAWLALEAEHGPPATKETES